MTDVIEHTAGKSGAPQETGLTLADIKEVLFNGEAVRHSDLDVLEEMAKGKDDLLRRIEGNKELAKRVGGKEALRAQFEALHEQYRMQVQHLAAAKDFQEKVEKKGIIRRILGKIGSFAKHHPFVTALLVAAAAAAGIGAGFYLTGNWELLMANVGSLRKQISAGVSRGLHLLDAKTPPMTGMGPEAIPSEAPINL